MAQSTQPHPRPTPSAGVLHPHPRGHPWERTAVGGLFLLTAGVHVGIVAADPGTYAGFADAALLPLVRGGWDQVFMAHPAGWGALLALAEAVLGVLLLASARSARIGWAGVLVFHVLLMLFGLGFWLYAVPAVGILAALALRDLRRSPR